MPAPRLLTVLDQVQARRELERLGRGERVFDEGPQRLLWKLVKVPALPASAAERLRQQWHALGGVMITGPPAEAEGGSVVDAILGGSPAGLRSLCRRLVAGPPDLAEPGRRLAGLLDRLEAPAAMLAGRTCRLACDGPLIMGILNVTPDSFSDGGRFASLSAALDHARRLVAEGADLLDVGGESTRPGAPAVPVAEELDRVIPVVEALTREFDVPVSVDTTKSKVAREAIAAGAEFVNDVSGLTFDREMASAISAGGAGAFLMHTRGRPETMQRDTRYADLLGDVVDALGASLERARQAGIADEKLAVDPGIGFGKDAAGNLEILRRLPELLSLGRPLLLGTSRKSFLGRLTGRSDPEQRLAATLATVSLGVAGGARIFRVHDVGPARDAALTAWAVTGGRAGTDG